MASFSSAEALTLPDFTTGTVGEFGAIESFLYADPFQAPATVVTLESPAEGAIAEDEELVVDVVNPDYALSLTILTATFADGTSEVVHDGSGFSADYLGSTRDVIGDGYEFTITRQDGWLEDPVLRILTADPLGNVLDTDFAFLFTPTGPATVVTLESPNDGDSITIDQELVVDVVNADFASPLPVTLILASFEDGSSEVVHDGTDFGAAYSGSTRDVITDGYEFTILRDGGWLENPQLRILTADPVGNTLDTDFGFLFTPTPPTPNSAPEVTIVSPLVDTLARTTPLVVDVTDDTLVKRVLLWVTFESLGTDELVFDGTSFTAKYSASARAAITGGYRFTIERHGGWAASPRLSAVAFDDVGEET